MASVSALRRADPVKHALGVVAKKQVAVRQLHEAHEAAEEAVGRPLRLVVLDEEPGCEGLEGRRLAAFGSDD